MDVDMQKSVSGIKHFYWVQPICYYYLYLSIEKRRLIAIASNGLSNDFAELLTNSPTAMYQLN